MTDELGIPLELSKELKRRMDERLRLKKEYGQLLDEIAAIFFRHDPIGINFDFNTDEYEAEAGTVLARIKEADSETDLRRVIREEFARWFAEDLAGPEARYTKIAHEVWEAWQRTLETRTLESGSLE